MQLEKRKELLKIEGKMYELIYSNAHFAYLLFREMHRANAELCILNNEDLEFNESLLDIVSNKLVGSLITEETIGGL